MSRLTSVSIDSRSAAGRERRRRGGAVLRALVVAGVAVPLLAGCGLFGGRSKKCHERQGYEAAESVPPLKSADGTPVQATRNALKIPAVSQTAKERTAGEPCLDEPPSFYPGRPKPGQAGAKAEVAAEAKADAAAKDKKD